MEKEKKKKKKIYRYPSPRKIIIDGNLTDFIKRYPDAIKKIEKFELSRDVRLSIKALPSDYKSLKTLLEINPHAFTAFIEHDLINPGIAKLKAVTHKRTVKTSVIKCLRLQAALLYGFFKYCKENNEYPNCLNKINFLTKHKSELDPSLFTALCLEIVFGKIRKDITKQNKFLSADYKRTGQIDNFKENMIDRGMKLLEKHDFQKQLDILNNFTLQILFLKPSVASDASSVASDASSVASDASSVASDAPSVASDASKIFTFLYYLNDTFYIPKQPIQEQKRTMPSDNQKEGIKKEETKEEKEEKERKVKEIKEAMKEADEIQCIASNAFPRLYQH